MTGHPTLTLADEAVRSVEPSGGELFWGSVTLLVAVAFAAACVWALLWWRRRHAA